MIDKSVFPGLQGGPHMHNITAKAVAFGEALKPEFRKYAKQILKNAKTLQKEMVKQGYKIVFGGTDNHMILADVFATLEISGKEAEKTLDAVGITVNKNMLPDDTRSPMDPSGIRIGVPAITTRGMKEKEVKQLALIIDEALRKRSDAKVLKSLRKEVLEMCQRFPIYC